MTTAQAAVEYRWMIRDKADLLNPGDAADIQNIITDPLPNGACCYVNTRRAVFYLNKFSTLTANGVDVFQPIAGPGRWILLVPATGGVPPVMLYSTTDQTNAFDTTGVFVQTSTTNYLHNEIGDIGKWTLTASGGVLTYNGPPAPYIVTLTGTARVQDGTPEIDIFAGISHNDDLGALHNGGVEGSTAWRQVGDNVANTFATQRLIPALQTGDTIRAKFGALADGVAGVVVDLQMIAQAA